MNKESHKGPPRINQARNTTSPRIQEEYITQVSEKVEGRVTKKLSRKFSRTESGSLGALSLQNEFLENAQPRTRSRTVPETSRNLSKDNEGTNEHGS